MAFEDKPGCKIIINYHLFSRQVVGKRKGSCTFGKEGMGGKERESYVPWDLKGNFLFNFIECRFGQTSNTKE